MRLTRREAMAGVGALGVGALAGCTGGGDGGDVGGDGDGGDSPGATVEMTNDLAFVPGSLSVDVGRTVTWTNVGSVRHTVTAYGDRLPDGAAYFASGGFDAEEAARDAFPNRGGIPAGDAYAVTFATSGTYEYFCIPHEATGMTGTVEVS